MTIFSKPTQFFQAVCKRRLLTGTQAFNVSQLALTCSKMPKWPLTLDENRRKDKNRQMVSYILLKFYTLRSLRLGSEAWSHKQHYPRPLLSYLVFVLRKTRIVVRPDERTNKKARVISYKY